MATAGTRSPGPSRASSGAVGSPATSEADTGIRRGPWSSEEDEVLLALVESHGPSNWVVIAHSLGSRSAKQCRERYHQNLKPSLDHGPIRPEEAEAIERLVGEIGYRWAEIARRLPGRSDNTIKNWFNGKQNRISRSEHMRSAAAAGYAAAAAPPPQYQGVVQGSPQHYRGHQHTASGGSSPEQQQQQQQQQQHQRHHTPSQGGQFQPPSHSPPDYAHRYDGSELAPYNLSPSGYGDGGHSVHHHHHPPAAARALELPPITGSLEARPRTPAAFHPGSNQLPGIHTVLPPLPDARRHDDGGQRSGASRMAVESIISR